MKRSLPVVIACCSLMLVAGCGSSNSGSSNSTSSTASKASAHEKLSVTTTPKFLSPSKSEPVRSGLIQIAYRDIAVNPAVLRVKLGSTIKWTNYDPLPHNVTSEGGPQKFASKNFGEGGTFEIKTNKPGVIHYESTNYPATMNGTIEVVG